MPPSRQRARRATRGGAAPAAWPAAWGTSTVSSTTRASAPRRALIGHANQAYCRQLVNQLESLENLGHPGTRHDAARHSGYTRGMDDGAGQPEKIILNQASRDQA